MTEEDKRYLNGKIYKIINSVNDKCYVGSTISTLNRRLIEHKCYSKKARTATSKILIDEDPDNVSIQLIELYPCLTKKELLLRERYWLENMECVNKQRPIITREEKIQEKNDYNRNSYQNNIEARIAYSKQRIQCSHCPMEYNRGHKNQHYRRNHSQFDPPKYV